MRSFDQMEEEEVNQERQERQVARQESRSRGSQCCRIKEKGAGWVRGNSVQFMTF